ncbi:glycerol-3-phosphate ABC transporter permease [Rugosimonospora africana]|uniref:Glycerol-3-phosphate ABC transporter permease n=1 Tax=Rugosimonospora africana TaxID=556532 RepID=A0A8J3VV61_9ACTN|nr:glycerol-3-phosphate ABC transporter permease [Rugosimonospora africana]
MRRHGKEYLLFVALVGPNLALILVFSYWPVIYNLYLSFTSWDMISPNPTWVGLAEYRELFTSADFGHVLANTGKFVVLIVVGSIVGGLATALILNQRLVGRGIVRTVSFAPHIVSGAAIATLWLFILDPSFGLLRAVLDPLGISSPQWTTNSQLSLYALVMVYVWKGIGFCAIIYVAGMQNLPADLFEAARLDGAGGWQRFRYVTFPLLSPVTYFLVVTSIIGAFQAYDVTAIMTGGGPGLSSTTLSWFIYQKAFQASDAGLAAAAAMVMLIMILAITILMTKYAERKVTYQ